MRIVGIGGTDGSGKDTVAQMLVERHGWLFISVTDILRQEAKRRGLPLEREQLRIIGNNWRRQFGLGVLVDKAMEIFEHESKKRKLNGLVLASLRNPGEAERVHELGGRVVWVDADPRVRYERIVSRNRGTEDHVSFEEFSVEEQVQMQHKGNEATVSLSGVKAK